MGATWFGKQHPTLTALLDELGITLHTKGISLFETMSLFLLKNLKFQMLRNLQPQGGTATLIKKIS
jgi:hypothetical protein